MSENERLTVFANQASGSEDLQETKNITGEDNECQIRNDCAESDVLKTDVDEGSELSEPCKVENVTCEKKWHHEAKACFDNVPTTSPTIPGDLHHAEEEEEAGNKALSEQASSPVELVAKPSGENDADYVKSGQSLNKSSSETVSGAHETNCLPCPYNSPDGEGLPNWVVPIDTYTPRGQNSPWGPQGRSEDKTDTGVTIGSLASAASVGVTMTSSTDGVGPAGYVNPNRDRFYGCQPPASRPHYGPLNVPLAVSKTLSRKPPKPDTRRKSALADRTIKPPVVPSESACTADSLEVKVSGSRMTFASKPRAPVKKVFVPTKTHLPKLRPQTQQVGAEGDSKKASAARPENKRSPTKLPASPGKFSKSINKTPATISGTSKLSCRPGQTPQAVLPQRRPTVEEKTRSPKAKPATRLPWLAGTCTRSKTVPVPVKCDKKFRDKSSSDAHRESSCIGPWRTRKESDSSRPAHPIPNFPGNRMKGAPQHAQEKFEGKQKTVKTTTRTEDGKGVSSIKAATVKADGYNVNNNARGHLNDNNAANSITKGVKQSPSPCTSHSVRKMHTLKKESPSSHIKRLTPHSSSSASHPNRCHVQREKVVCNNHKWDDCAIDLCYTPEITTSNSTVRSVANVNDENVSQEERIHNNSGKIIPIDDEKFGKSSEEDRKRHVSDSFEEERMWFDDSDPNINLNNNTESNTSTGTENCDSFAEDSDTCDCREMIHSNSHIDNQAAVGNERGKDSEREKIEHLRSRETVCDDNKTKTYEANSGIFANTHTSCDNEISSNACLGHCSSKKLCNDNESGSETNTGYPPSLLGGWTSVAPQTLSHSGDQYELLHPKAEHDMTSNNIQRKQSQNKMQVLESGRSVGSNVLCEENKGTGYTDSSLGNVAKSKNESGSKVASNSENKARLFSDLRKTIQDSSDFDARSSEEEEDRTLPKSQRDNNSCYVQRDLDGERHRELMPETQPSNKFSKMIKTIVNSSDSETDADDEGLVNDLKLETVRDVLTPTNIHTPRQSKGRIMKSDVDLSKGNPAATNTTTLPRSDSTTRHSYAELKARALGKVQSVRAKMAAGQEQQTSAVETQEMFNSAAQSAKMELSEAADSFLGAQYPNLTVLERESEQIAALTYEPSLRYAPSDWNTDVDKSSGNIKTGKETGQCVASSSPGLVPIHSVENDTSEKDLNNSMARCSHEVPVQNSGCLTATGGKKGSPTKRMYDEEHRKTCPRSKIPVSQKKKSSVINGKKLPKNIVMVLKDKDGSAVGTAKAQLNYKVKHVDVSSEAPGLASMNVHADSFTDTSTGDNNIAVEVLTDKLLVASLSGSSNAFTCDEARCELEGGDTVSGKSPRRWRQKGLGSHEGAESQRHRSRSRIPRPRGVSEKRIHSSRDTPFVDELKICGDSIQQHDCKVYNSTTNEISPSGKPSVSKPGYLELQKRKKRLDTGKAANSDNNTKSEHAKPSQQVQKQSLSQSQQLQRKTNKNSNKQQKPQQKQQRKRQQQQQQHQQQQQQGNIRQCRCAPFKRLVAHANNTPERNQSSNKGNSQTPTARGGRSTARPPSTRRQGQVQLQQTPTPQQQQQHTAVACPDVEVSPTKYRRLVRPAEESHDTAENLMARCDLFSSDSSRSGHAGNQRPVRRVPVPAWSEGRQADEGPSRKDHHATATPPESPELMIKQVPGSQQTNKGNRCRDRGLKAQGGPAGKTKCSPSKGKRKTGGSRSRSRHTCERVKQTNSMPVLKRSSTLTSGADRRQTLSGPLEDVGRDVSQHNSPCPGKERLLVKNANRRSPTVDRHAKTLPRTGGCDKRQEGCFVHGCLVEKNTPLGPGDAKKISNLKCFVQAPEHPESDTCVNKPSPKQQVATRTVTMLEEPNKRRCSESPQRSMKVGPEVPQLTKSPPHYLREKTVRPRGAPFDKFTLTSAESAAVTDCGGYSNPSTHRPSKAPSPVCETAVEKNESDVGLCEAANKVCVVHSSENERFDDCVHAPSGVMEAAAQPETTATAPEKTACVLPSPPQPRRKDATYSIDSGSSWQDRTSENASSSNLLLPKDDPHQHHIPTNVSHKEHTTQCNNLCEYKFPATVEGKDRKLELLSSARGQVTTLTSADATMKNIPTLDTELVSASLNNTQCDLSLRDSNANVSQNKSVSRKTSARKVSFGETYASSYDHNMEAAVADNNPTHMKNFPRRNSQSHVKTELSCTPRKGSITLVGLENGSSDAGGSGGFDFDMNGCADEHPSYSCEAEGFGYTSYGYEDYEEDRPSSRSTVSSQYADSDCSYESTDGERSPTPADVPLSARGMGETSLGQDQCGKQGGFLGGGGCADEDDYDIEAEQECGEWQRLNEDHSPTDKELPGDFHDFCGDNDVIFNTNYRHSPFNNRAGDGVSKTEVLFVDHDNLNADAYGVCCSGGGFLGELCERMDDQRRRHEDDDRKTIDAAAAATTPATQTSQTTPSDVSLCEELDREYNNFIISSDGLAEGDTMKSFDHGQRRAPKLGKPAAGSDPACPSRNSKRGKKQRERTTVTGSSASSTERQLPPLSSRQTGLPHRQKVRRHY